MLNLLAKVSQSAATEEAVSKKVNPKRLARLAAAEMSKTGVSTKAQQALQLEYEQRQKEQAALSKERKEALEERKRELKREKAKEKHRGR
jgi:Protein of unknown function (DUF2992).